MAHAVAPDLASTIDHYLDYLAAEWGGIAEVVAEWATWDEREQLDFVLEWPIREDRLRQVQHWVADGVLTDRQRRALSDLERLIAGWRPALEQLLAE
jgi:hypothetical protein